MNGCFSKRMFERDRKKERERERKRERKREREREERERVCGLYLNVLKVQGATTIETKTVIGKEGGGVNMLSYKPNRGKRLYVRTQKLGWFGLNKKTVI